MGLLLTGSQWLEALWSPGGTMGLKTFMGFLRRTNATGEHSVVSAGNVNADEAFDNLQAWDDRTRAISFVPYGEARSNTVIPAAQVTFICGVFTATQLIVYVGDEAPVSVAWSPGASVINRLRIGQVVAATWSSPMQGVLEHVAIWNTALTQAQVTALRTLAASPLDTEPASLVSYHPFKGSMEDLVPGLTWTPVGLSDPVYVDLGITYGPTGYQVTYNANGGRNAPTDPSSPYEAGATVTVLAPGSMERPGYTFAGWNTAADGSGTPYAQGATFSMPQASVTLYAQWTRGARIVNHDNFAACDSANNATIASAAVLDVYFEHASTGRDIVGNSGTNTSSGTNYDGTQPCGLAELYAVNNRYLALRSSYESANDSTWFSSNNGLQDNNRGNPEPLTKRTGFMAISAAMRAAIRVAMWKYCWIDVWPETTGYISDGAAAASADITAANTFESENPGIAYVFWTMPLQSGATYAAREAYNDAIRRHCAANNKYLIDIADITCHDVNGTKRVDANGRELMIEGYAMPDGGHLASAGRLRMARAYWTMLTIITGAVTYKIQGVTRDKNGAILGGCTVYLLKREGDWCNCTGIQQSDPITGVYSFERPDNDATYFVAAFVESGGVRLFDVSDCNIQPVV